MYCLSILIEKVSNVHLAKLGVEGLEHLQLISQYIGVEVQGPLQPRVLRY